MIKNLILVFSIAIASNTLFSQRNFQPGSVVTVNGDTLKGEIDYKNWKRTPERISFRKDQGTSPVAYGVNEISFFSVSDDVYKRAVVDIVEREDNLNSLRLTDSFPARTDTVFLLTLISGPKALYQYTDNVDHFYISKEEGGFDLLNYRKFRDVNQNVSTIRVYIGQLKTYFKNCSVVSDNLQYKPSPLRKAFLAYYDCTGKNPDYFHKSEDETVEIGVLVGATNTSLNIVGENEQLFTKTKYSRSTDITGGVFFDIVFPRLRRRLSLNNEFMYSSYEVEGVYSYRVNPFIVDDYNYQFRYAYVKLNNMLRYKFFANNFIIFVNGGMTNGIAVKEQHTFFKVRTANGEVSTIPVTEEPETRKWELGFLVGAGARKNRGSLELRAERGSGPFSAINYSAKVYRFSALLGYRFR